MKRSAGTAALVPSEVLTCTAVTPVVPGGENATMLVSDLTSKLFAGVDPNVTASAPREAAARDRHGRTAGRGALLALSLEIAGAGGAMRCWQFMVWLLHSC